MRRWSSWSRSARLRRKRRFRDGDTVVELSVDDVEVIARAHVVERFIELEVELSVGPEEPLLALREALDADPALTPSGDVEAGRGAGRGRLGRPRAVAGRTKGRSGDRDGARTALRTSPRSAAATGSRRGGRAQARITEARRRPGQRRWR